MRYDDIFTKPIEECTDDEIRERAMAMRKDAKLTRRGKKKKDNEFETDTEPNEEGVKKDKTGKMLEEMMNNARLKNKGETK